MNLRQVGCIAAVVMAASSLRVSEGMSQSPRVMPSPCTLLLDQALDAASTGDLVGADAFLNAADGTCPDPNRVRRERAAIRFKQGQYREASSLARAYLELAPQDTLAWDLLATSYYLHGDRSRALQAWNQIGLPRIDSLRIDGSTRSARRIMAFMGWTARGILTGPPLTMARRRIADLPSIEHSNVTYQMNLDGTVDLRAMAFEKPVVEPVWRIAAKTAVRALASDVIGMEVVNPSGAGERWLAEWRWEAARPRRSIGVELPVRLGNPGVLRVAVAWQRVRVAPGPGADEVVEDTWSSGEAGFGTWILPWVRSNFEIGVEQWNANREYLTTTLGTEIHLADDRLRIRLNGKRGHALHSKPSYHVTAIRGWYASSMGLVRPTWSARLGGEWASKAAPLGSWPLVTGNLSRGIALRAEPSTAHDALRGGATGRGLLHAGLSIDQPVKQLGPLGLGIGLFLDGARIHRPATVDGGSRNYLDAGMGVLVSLAGGALGFVRFDAAWGLLQQGRAGFAMGYHAEWPPWKHEPR